MERLSEHERQLVWRCLVAYSSDPIRSEELVGERGPIASAVNDGFAGVNASADGRQCYASPTLLDTSSLGLRREGHALLHYLSTLEREDRRMLISRHIAHLDLPSMEGDRSTDSRLEALEERLELELDGSVDRIFDSLRQMESPPSLATDGGKNRAAYVLRALAALGAVAGAAILMRFVLTAPATAAQERIEAPSDTASDLTDSVDLVQLVSDPSRDIRLFIDDEQFVVRSDPETGRVMWRSGPHDAAVIHRIDANTVTLDRVTRRVYLSLRDGTVLPP